MKLWMDTRTLKKKNIPDYIGNIKVTRFSENDCEAMDKQEIMFRTWIQFIQT